MHTLRKLIRLQPSTKAIFLQKALNYPQIYYRPNNVKRNPQITLKRTFQLNIPKTCRVAVIDDEEEKTANKLVSENEINELLDEILECRSTEAHSSVLEGRIRSLCARYSNYSPESVMIFLRTLATNYGVDHIRAAELCRAVVKACESQNTGAILRAENELRSCLQSRSFWLFKQIGRTSDGVKFLVDFRKDILEALAYLDRTDPSVPHLRAINSKLNDLLAMWFSTGSMDMHKITWNSPCESLQKICEYEELHPVMNFNELKNRIGPNRRCYMFNHPAMPNEPIYVLNVLLSNTILTSLTDVKQQSKENCKLIDTANIYSVLSPQKGLKNIDMGNQTLKTAVKAIQSEFPKMRRFLTLSPIPGFYNWLLHKLLVLEHTDGAGLTQFFTLEELSNMAPLINVQIANMSENPNKMVCTELRRTLTTPTWFTNMEMRRHFQKPLLRLCARYLYNEKRDLGYALDSVANFHLRNGGIMWKLNWNADPTPEGLSRSCGMMVNYRYFIDTADHYGTHYIDKKVIEANDAITDLVREATALKTGETIEQTQDSAVFGNPPVTTVTNNVVTPPNNVVTPPNNVVTPTNKVTPQSTISTANVTKSTTTTEATK